MFGVIQKLIYSSIHEEDVNESRFTYYSFEKIHLLVILLVSLTHSGCVAYSMSDSVVYIRKFSRRQAEMKVVGTLSGHSDEVTQVRV